MNDFARRRARHLALGRRGENDAVRLLEYHGCLILARNFRVRAGELDIVARDGAVLVFVEVKTRRRRDAYRPADNLSPRQLRRNFAAARIFRQDYASPAFPCRFDLIEVVRTGRRLLEIRHHRNFVAPSAR